MTITEYRFLMVVEDIPRVIATAVRMGRIVDGRGVTTIDPIGRIEWGQVGTEGRASSYELRPRDRNVTKFIACSFDPCADGASFWLSAYNPYDSREMLFPYPVAPEFLVSAIEAIGFPLYGNELAFGSSFPTYDHPRWAIAEEQHRKLHPPKEERPPAVVYFAQSEQTGNIKIGHSRNPEKRIKGFKAGVPGALNILATMAGGSKLEHELHIRFKEHRVGGEWFRPHSDIIAFIKKNTRRDAANEKHGAGADDVARALVNR